MHYVYKITNKTNGKTYIGKRKHNSPETDKYMGSGKLIQAAISKYGVDSFTKEVLAVFDTDEAAARLEKELVNREYVESDMTYNLHEGGSGGFMHINHLPPEDRVNVKSLKGKVARGEIKVGGTANWSDEAWGRVLEQGKKNLSCGPDNWSRMSEDRRNITRKKIADKVSGSNNSAYGTHIYVDKTAMVLPPIEVLNTQRYIDGQQPDGWITVSEWKDCRKRKTGAYGRKWYNDGIKNFYLLPDDELVCRLVRGRLKTA